MLRFPLMTANKNGDLPRTEHTHYHLLSHVVNKHLLRLLFLLCWWITWKTKEELEVLNIFEFNNSTLLEQVLKRHFPVIWSLSRLLLFCFLFFLVPIPHLQYQNPTGYLAVLLLTFYITLTLSFCYYCWVWETTV